MIENRPEPSYTVIPRFYSLKSTRRGDTAHTDRDATQEKRERREGWDRILGSGQIMDRQDVERIDVAYTVVAVVAQTQARWRERETRGRGWTRGMYCTTR